MKHLFILFFIGGMLLARGQHLPNPLLSAVSAAGGYGNAHHDIFGVLVNPASIAHTTQFTAGIYGERRYMLEGLQQFCGILQFPFIKSGLGLQLDYNGSALMNESAFGLAYGKKLGDKLSTGLRFRYYQLQIPGHVRASALWAEAGLLFQLTPQLQTGFSLSRSTQSALSPTEQPLTQVYRFGLGYEPSKYVCISTDWIKETHKSLMGTLAILYAIEEGLRLRLAWQTTTNQPVAGAGFHWKGCWTDIIVSYHPMLGFTPAFQMMWGASTRKQK